MMFKILFQTILCLVCIQSFSTKNYEELDESERIERIDNISKCDDKSLPKKKIVCFYRVEEEFRPYDLDPCLCTHIIYSYVAVRENFAFIAGKKGDLKYLSALKQQNPNLKILVSLRPSNNQFILEETEKSNTTSLAVRTKFAKRVREFITRHVLDGVDLDWEYFKEAQNQITKRQTLISVLRILSNELKPLNESEESHYLLTITASKYARDLADYYDFSEFYSSIDFVNVPAFNFDANPKKVVHPSRLHGMTDMENMDSLIDLVLALGLPQEQLIIGVPAHGTLYKLLNTSLTEPGSPASAWNNEEVIISHSKICAVRDNTNWTLVRDKDLTAPYVYYRDKWIGFDDEISIKLKAKYSVLRGMGGLALWSLNDDDSSGKCGYGPFPLLQTIRSVFLKPMENINYLKINSTIDSNSDENRIPSENSFVAVIEKYGNVERITGEESDENQLSCSHSGYQRHPNDCSKFYRCIKFNPNDENPEKFQYNCPYGLVFDERYEMCNWPSWSPPCLGSGEIVSTNKKRFVCPSYGYFQDPENCEFFYYCSDFGKMYLQSYQMKCPFDLAFDEEKLLCNWKWLVRGCGPINPEDQVIKDLPQLLNQNTESEEIVDISRDKLMERSDMDSEHTFSALNTDNSHQNTNPDRKDSKFRRITQYMGKLVGNLSNKLKSFWFTKMESRSDKSGNRWLSRVNQYMPKLQRKRQNSEPNDDRNKRYSSKQRRPYINDPLITIPILEIRPETHNLRNSQNRQRPQTQQKTSLNSGQTKKRHRNPINSLPLNRFQDQNDLFHISSITRTVQKLQDMIPLRTKNREKQRPREPLGMPSNMIGVTKLPKTPLDLSQKSSRIPPKNSRLKSKFHFPTVEPLIIETLEELKIPHYLPQQVSQSISLQSIPGPKRPNIRDQQQRHHLESIRSQKEVLHFTPDQLNLDNIKIQTKPGEQIRDKDSKQKTMKTYKDNIQTQINFHNIDAKLLDSLQYSLSESDINNKKETIHLAKNPNKEIKVNVNKESKPSVTQKDNSAQRLTQINHNLPKDSLQMHEWLQYSSETYQIPQIHAIQSQLSNTQPIRERPQTLSTKQINQKLNINERQRNAEPMKNNPIQRQRDQNINQKPLNKLHSEPQTGHQNKHLPKAELIPQQSLPQLRPESVPQKQQQRHQINRLREPSQPAVKFNSKAQPVIYWPNTQEFESTKIVINEQNGNKGSIRVTNRPNVQITPGVHHQNHRQNDFNDRRNKNPVNNPRIQEYSGINHKITEQMDTSATIDDYYASNYHQNQRHVSEKANNKLNPIEDNKHKNQIKSHEKSQLLIIPVSEEYSEENKFTNIEKITKDFPKLFTDGLVSDHKNKGFYEKTTARPRVIFTAPSPVSTAGPPQDEEYIMLMLNNEHNLLNSTDNKKSIHELFKKTDGKLYNLETDSSKTLVALVPKSQTTPKPVLYESIPNMVSFNVTQPPVVIKFEIPRPKSQVFQSIVQKVRDEWLSAPYAQPVYHTLPPYQVIRNDYQNQYTQQKESTTAQPFIPVTYQTISTSNLIHPTQAPVDNGNHGIPASIYDSLQQLLSQTNWDQPINPSQLQDQINAMTGNQETTTPPSVTTSSQSSVILEHIPLYNGYNNNNNNNHTNGMSWPQSALPWYQQVVPAYPSPVNPYPPIQSYPQIPMSGNYPYYPIHNGYGYPAPNIGQPSHVFQPQFLSPNLTSNNWYDFYAQNSPDSGQQPTESTSIPITSTVIITTTESPATSPPTTQRSAPKVRNRPSFARRTTTKRPKTTVTEIKTEIPTENPFDIQRTNSEKPQIEVFIVDQSRDKGSEVNHKRPLNQKEIPSQADVKVVYIDGNKEDIKQTHYSTDNQKETQERYGFRNGVKVITKPNHKNTERQPIQHQLPTEPQYVQQLPPLTEPNEPKVEHQIIKDIEYEDEPEISSSISDELKGQQNQPFIPTSKVESMQNIYDSNTYPGLRNFTDTSVPESACTRPGLFQHPYDCNKYYECYWDKYINKFTLHSFECPVKLAFDSRIVGCGLPHDPTICVQY